MITTPARHQPHAAVSMSMVSTALVGDAVLLRQPPAAMITPAAAHKSILFVTLMHRHADWYVDVLCLLFIISLVSYHSCYPVQYFSYSN